MRQHTQKTHTQQRRVVVKSLWSGKSEVNECVCVGVCLIHQLGLCLCVGVGVWGLVYDGVCVRALDVCVCGRADASNSSARIQWVQHHIKNQQIHWFVILFWCCGGHICSSVLRDTASMKFFPHFFCVEVGPSAKCFAGYLPPV